MTYVRATAMRFMPCLFFLLNLIWLNSYWIECTFHTHTHTRYTFKLTVSEVPHIQYITGNGPFRDDLLNTVLQPVRRCCSSVCFCVMKMLLCVCHSISEGDCVCLWRYTPSFTNCFQIIDMSVITLETMTIVSVCVCRCVCIPPTLTLCSAFV